MNSSVSRSATGWPAWLRARARLRSAKSIYNTTERTSAMLRKAAVFPSVVHGAAVSLTLYSTFEDMYPSSREIATIGI